MVTVVCVTGGLVCPADDTRTVTEYFLNASRWSSVTPVMPSASRSTEVSSPLSWQRHSTSKESKSERGGDQEQEREDDERGKQ